MANSALPQLIALGFAVTVVLAIAALWAMSRRFGVYYQRTVLETTNVNLSDMFIFMDGRQLTRISVIATVMVPIVLLRLSGNPLLAIGGAVACLLGPILVHKRLLKKRRAMLIRQLPDTLDALVGGLRSGLSLPQALGLLSEQLPKPSNQEFALVVRKLRIGVGLDIVLEELEQRVKSNEYTMFTTGMLISREVGGNLTESLERLADTMRRKLTMEDKIIALTSQGKMQGWIVGSLPLFLMWVLTEMEPEAMAPLYSTWIGYGVLALIFVLELIGYVVIRKIVTINV
jgi:tight adherence protein B